MPMQSYGVLIGRPIEVRLGAGENAHYQVHLIDDQAEYRIAINVRSALSPSEVEYIVVDHFEHPILEKVGAFASGYSELVRQPNGGGLDYIRGNLFDRSQMRPLPFNVPGADNDLNEKIDRLIQRALGDEEAVVYAFGERWGPEANRRDKFFGFLPGNGIHNIHMNQGNVGRFIGDDSVWQDGGIILRFPGQNQWSAIFLKFQSQSWHTDDTTGHRLASLPDNYPRFEVPAGSENLPPAAPTRPRLPTYDDPEGLVRIVAAMVNSPDSPEVERITLLNRAAHAIDFSGWAILDTQEQRLGLKGSIDPGGIRIVEVHRPFALSNRGGIISLVDDRGLKVDGASYTREQAEAPGWTIIF